MKNYLSALFPCFNSFQKKTYCPVCQEYGRGFTPLPDLYRSNAEKYGYLHFGKGEMTALSTYSCTNCGASDRERLYAWWLSKSFIEGNKSPECKAIHFAPEGALSNFIKLRNLFTQYQTADFMMEGVDHKIDLMNLPFASETYDFFICSHVLEHVTDDKKAIAELYRITRSGGKGILMAPIITDLPQTIEDPNIESEAERWRLFGQNDHVRLYSREQYVQRIIEAGFNVQQLTVSFFGSKIFKMLGLKPSSVLYIAIKP